MFSFLGFSNKSSSSEAKSSVEKGPEIDRLGSAVEKLMDSEQPAYDPDEFAPLCKPLAHISDLRRLACLKAVSSEDERVALTLAAAEIDLARKLARERVRVANRRARQHEAQRRAQQRPTKSLTDFVKEESITNRFENQALNAAGRATLITPFARQVHRVRPSRPATACLTNAAAQVELPPSIASHSWRLMHHDTIMTKARASGKVFSQGDSIERDGCGPTRNASTTRKQRAQCTPQAPWTPSRGSESDKGKARRHGTVTPREMQRSLKDSFFSPRGW